MARRYWTAAGRLKTDDEGARSERRLCGLYVAWTTASGEQVRYPTPAIRLAPQVAAMGPHAATCPEAICRMITIRTASLPQDGGAVYELFAEYLPWVCGRIWDEYRVEFDAASILAHDTDELSDYMPPNGLTLLAFESGALAGCACMRQNGDQFAELKRMYVRPAFRRHGIGRLLLAEILRAARLDGFLLMRLDSAGFMREAHALYRSFGFTIRTPYAGSEIPPEHSRHWVHVELDLTKAEWDGPPDPIRHHP